MDNLRVSTITAIGKLFTNNIDLNKVYNFIDINDIFRFIKYNKLTKGCDPNQKKKNIPKKDFFNQMTIHIYDGVKTNGKKVNVKIFNNGRIQMTGLIKIDQGNNIINLLHTALSKSSDIDLVEKDNFDLDIVLINSDFDYKQIINRDRLYLHLLDKNIFVTYESCIYPGVNIKYYYKKNNHSGICNCINQCDGKGDGINKCKKVTIAAFHSGKVIITGGKSFDQLEKSYEFITNELDYLFKNK
jgi:TATA-box binding protein (TBP) (component of TFIID and TFIIIB)